MGNFAKNLNLGKHILPLSYLGVPPAGMEYLKHWARFWDVAKYNVIIITDVVFNYFKWYYTPNLKLACLCTISNFFEKIMYAS